MEMEKCTLKERLKSFGLGIVCAVVLGGMAWAAVMFTWASSSSVLNSAPNHTDRLMMDRSVILVAGSAGLPAER
jgi:hypothetical protein